MASKAKIPSLSHSVGLVPKMKRRFVDPTNDRRVEDIAFSFQDGQANQKVLFFGYFSLFYFESKLEREHLS